MNSQNEKVSRRAGDSGIPFSRALTLFLAGGISIYAVLACLIVWMGARWTIAHTPIIGGLLLLSVVVVLVAVALGKSLFAEPLNDLRGKVADLLVNPTAVTQLTSSQIDEIQLLGRDVALLAERAYTREQALHMAYVDMEQRVASRTEQLREEIVVRENAERQLEQSLALLRAAFDAAADGILAVDMAGRILSYNARFVAMWGIPEDILLRRNDDAALNYVLDQIRNPEQFVDRVRTLYATPESIASDVIELRDGRVIERQSRPQHIGEKIVGRVWCFRDITERQRTEEALRYNNFLLNACNQAQSQFIADVGVHVLFRNLLGDILDLTCSSYAFIGDVRTGDDGTRYVWAEGYSQAAVAATHDALVEEAVNEPFEIRDRGSLIGRALEQERPVMAGMDELLTAKSGLPANHPAVSNLLAVPFFAAGGMAGVVVVGNRAIDFTDEDVRRLEPLLVFCASLLDAHTNARRRREAEAALRENEARLRAIVDTAVEGIVTVDKAGIIDMANLAAANLFGHLSPEDLVGHSVDRLIPESERPPLGNFLQWLYHRGWRTGHDAKHAIEGLRRNGDRFPMDVAVSQFQMGVRTMYTGILRDVTERVQYEEQLRYRAEFENLVASLSTEFINLPACRTDDGIRRALRSVCEFIGVERGHLYSFDQDGRRMRHTHAWQDPAAPDMDAPPVLTADDVPWSMGILRRLEPVCVSRVNDLPPEAVVERKICEEHNAKSFLAVPIISKGRAIGALVFVSLRRTIDWPHDTIALLRLVGEICANALERKRADEALAHARQQEVENAARVQQMLLTGTPPANLPGFGVSAVTVPSQGVDGDFYDFLVHTPRMMDVVVGDVMGKGMDAALVGAATKAHVTQALNRLLETEPASVTPDPACIVNQLHAEMAPQLISLETFVTLCVVRFDLDHKRLLLVDAGHTKTVHISARNGSWRELSGGNLPLGVDEREVYRATDLPFEEGDTFVFYSDGVTEARGADGTFFGRGRLLSLLCENAAKSPAALSGCVRAAVSAFTGRAALSDDLTVVVVRVSPSGNAAPLSRTAVELAADVAEISRLRAFLRQSLAENIAWVPSRAVVEAVELASVEAVTNAIKYAAGSAPGSRVRVAVEVFPNRIEVLVSDSGKAFTPTAVALPSPECSSGLGLYIMYKTMDMVEFDVHGDGSNCVRLVKYREETEDNGDSHGEAR